MKMQKKLEKLMLRFLAKILDIFTYEMYFCNMICLSFMHQPIRSFCFHTCAHRKDQRATEVFENLKGIRLLCGNRGKKLRSYMGHLNLIR